MKQICVSPAELAQTFRIWLRVLRQRRPDILRELWRRGSEPRDQQKEVFACAELAREITERLQINKWEVTREATPQEEMQGYEVLKAGSKAAADRE